MAGIVVAIGVSMLGAAITLLYNKYFRKNEEHGQGGQAMLVGEAVDNPPSLAPVCQ